MVEEEEGRTLSRVLGGVETGYGVVGKSWQITGELPRRCILWTEERGHGHLVVK